jgi:hypothetical protein
MTGIDNSAPITRKRWSLRSFEQASNTPQFSSESSGSGKYSVKDNPEVMSLGKGANHATGQKPSRLSRLRRSGSRLLSILRLSRHSESTLSHLYPP